MLLTRCPDCEHVNPTGSKFCNACGAPLNLLPCPSCGAINDVRAVECRQCGAELSAARGESPSPAQEAGPRAAEAAPDAPTRTEGLVDAFFGLRMPGRATGAGEASGRPPELRPGDGAPRPGRTADPARTGHPLPGRPDEPALSRGPAREPGPGPDRERPERGASRAPQPPPGPRRPAAAAPAAPPPRAAPAPERAGTAGPRRTGAPRHSAAVLIALAVALTALYGGYAYWQFATERSRPTPAAREPRTMPEAMPRANTAPPAPAAPSAPAREAAAPPPERVEKPRLEPPAAADASRQEQTPPPATGTARRGSDASPIQRSVDVGPCTEQVAALGLCTPQPTPRSP